MNSMKKKKPKIIYCLCCERQIFGRQSNAKYCKICYKHVGPLYRRAYSLGYSKPEHKFKKNKILDGLE